MTTEAVFAVGFDTVTVASYRGPTVSTSAGHATSRASRPRRSRERSHGTHDVRETVARTLAPPRTVTPTGPASPAPRSKWSGSTVTGIHRHGAAAAAAVVDR